MNERDVDLCSLAEQLARQMGLAAPVGGGKLHSPRRFVDEPNQFCHIAGRNFFVQSNSDGLLADLPIGTKAFCRSTCILPSCVIGRTVKVEACVT